MNVKIISKAVILMLVALVSCNVQKAVSLFVVTGAADEVTISSATLSGTFVSSNAMSATATVWFYIGTDSDNLERNGIKVSAGSVPSAAGYFSAVATGLEPNSIYYYVAYASMDGVQSVGSVSSFTTLSRPKEMIFTAGADKITEHSAHLYGYVDLEQTGPSVEFGIIVSRNENPTEGNGTVWRCYEVDRNNKLFAEVTGLLFATEYYYKAYVKVGTLLRVGEVKMFTTLGKQIVPGTYPEVVDLGLSVKWASFNLGATTPEEYGDYYAWGETEPKTDYTWASYRWCKGSDKALTKYCSTASYGYNGFTDNRTVLDPEDDAVTFMFGGNWRMPTYEEWNELKDNCTWEWTTINGVYGMMLTSNKIDYTDKWIFLPATGCRVEEELYDENKCTYWSSSLNTGNPGDAYNVFFGSGWSYYGRELGRSIRPVCE